MEIAAHLFHDDRGVFVHGSAPALGEWNNGGKPLRLEKIGVDRYRLRDPVWVSTGDEFKFLIIDKDRNPVWESLDGDGNRMVIDSHLQLFPHQPSFRDRPLACEHQRGTQLDRSHISEIVKEVVDEELARRRSLPSKAPCSSQQSSRESKGFFGLFGSSTQPDEEKDRADQFRIQVEEDLQALRNKLKDLETMQGSLRKDQKDQAEEVSKTTKTLQRLQAKMTSTAVKSEDAEPDEGFKLQKIQTEVSQLEQKIKDVAAGFDSIRTDADMVQANFGDSKQAPHSYDLHELHAQVAADVKAIEQRTNRTLKDMSSEIFSLRGGAANLSARCDQLVQQESSVQAQLEELQEKMSTFTEPARDLHSQTMQDASLELGSKIKGIEAAHENLWKKQHAQSQEASTWLQSLLQEVCKLRSDTEEILKDVQLDFGKKMTHFESVQENLRKEQLEQSRDSKEACSQVRLDMEQRLEDVKFKLGSKMTDIESMQENLRKEQRVQSTEVAQTTKQLQRLKFDLSKLSSATTLENVEPQATAVTADAGSCKDVVLPVGTPMPEVPRELDAAEQSMRNLGRNATSATVTSLPSLVYPEDSSTPAVKSPTPKQEEVHAVQGPAEGARGFNSFDSEARAATSHMSGACLGEQPPILTGGESSWAPSPSGRKPGTAVAAVAVAVAAAAPSRSDSDSTARGAAEAMKARSEKLEQLEATWCDLGSRTFSGSLRRPLGQDIAKTTSLPACATIGSAATPLRQYAENASAWDGSGTHGLDSHSNSCSGTTAAATSAALPSRNRSLTPAGTRRAAAKPKRDKYYRRTTKEGAIEQLAWPSDDDEESLDMVFRFQEMLMKARDEERREVWRTILLEAHSDKKGTKERSGTNAAMAWVNSFKEACTKKEINDPDWKRYFAAP